MRDDVDFCIEFIKEVQSHPCLYDSLNLDYGNTRQIQIAWKKIATKFDENEVNCRRKWKVIRSSYMRSFHNKLKGGSAKKEYYLSPYLHFLRPFMKPRLQDVFADMSDEDDSHNAKGDDDNDCDNDDNSDAGHDDQANANANEHIPRTETPNTLDENVIGSKRKRAGRGWVDPMFVNVKREEEAPAPERDPCEMYLLSLGPHIRTMDLRQQLQFQRGVVDLIEKIKYGD